MQFAQTAPPPETKRRSRMSKWRELLRKIKKEERSVKIRTAQIETAKRATQLASAVFKLGRAIWAIRRRVIPVRHPRVFLRYFFHLLFIPHGCVRMSIFQFAHSSQYPELHSVARAPRPRKCKNYNNPLAPASKYSNESGVAIYAPSMESGMATSLAQHVNPAALSSE